MPTLVNKYSQRHVSAYTLALYFATLRVTLPSKFTDRREVDCTSEDVRHLSKQIAKITASLSQIQHILFFVLPNNCIVGINK